MISEETRRDVNALVERLEAAGLAAAVLVLDQSGEATIVSTRGIVNLPGFLRLFINAIEAQAKRGPAS